MYIGYFLFGSDRSPRCADLGSVCVCLTVCLSVCPLYAFRLKERASRESVEMSCSRLQYHEKALELPLDLELPLKETLNA